jgi:hypothetical protein
MTDNGAGYRQAREALGLRYLRTRPLLRPRLPVAKAERFIKTMSRTGPTL